MIIQPDLLTHWKFQALCGIIGRAEAFTALLALWGHCQNSKTYVFDFTLPMLAGVCQYQGDAATLRTALLDCRILAPLENGSYEVHGWAEKNAAFVKNWDNGAKGGRPKTAPNQNPAGTQPPASHNPAETQPPISDNPAGTQPRNSKTLRPPEGRKEGIEGRNEGGEGSAAPGSAPVLASEIHWSPDHGWTGFTPEIRAILAKSFPGIDLDLACIESDRYFKKNPAKANKKDWFRTLTNWLRRSSPSPGSTGAHANEKSGEKNEGGPPPTLVSANAPPLVWNAAFESTYGRWPDAEWPDLPPAIQREIRSVLAAAQADELLQAAWREKERASA